MLPADNQERDWKPWVLTGPDGRQPRTTHPDSRQRFRVPSSTINIHSQHSCRHLPAEGRRVRAGYLRNGPPWVQTAKSIPVRFFSSIHQHGVLGGMGWDRFT